MQARKEERWISFPFFGEDAPEKSQQTVITIKKYIKKGIDQMKKLTSILLVLMMILCMGTTAFADETPTTNITINDADGRTYSGYQLLTLTSSHKTTVTSCGGNHTSECYNYSYTVKGKYREILQNEVYDNAVPEFWTTDDPKPEADPGASGVTDAQILDYLSKLAGDNNADDTYGTLRDAADRIYRVIKSPDTTPTISPDVTLDYREVAAKTVDQGYWLIADVTDLGGEEDKANSLVMVNTKGQDTLTITPKTALPKLEKKVKDINDSEDADIDDNDWVDSADHDKNDPVPFKLTATLPENLASYTTYMIKFHDTLSEGLELDTNSIKVYMYESMAAAGAATIPNDTAHEVVGFTPSTTGLKDTCSFEILCEDVLDIEGVDKDTVFVVYYEAKLNEAAVIGGSGNSNTAYLEFSNDPYDAAKTGQTQKDTVKVYTYKLVINKVDAADQPLEGAGFTLYKKDAAGAYKVVGSEVKGDGMTTFTWEHLDDGDYKLEETTVPAGFNKMEDKVFTIKATHDVTQTTLTSTLGKVTDGTITDEVKNLTGTVLPSTGAKGTMMLIGGGSVFIVLAAVFMITRKKMSVYED